MDYHKHITIESGKHGGKQPIRELRITVSDVLEYLAAGMSPEQVVEARPDPTVEDIRAALSYAVDLQRKLTTGIVV